MNQYFFKNSDSLAIVHKLGKYSNSDKKYIVSMKMVRT